MKNVFYGHEIFTTKIFTTKKQKKSQKYKIPKLFPKKYLDCN